MNVRRIAVQGFIIGAGALSIATQGFQPITEASTGGGGARLSIPPAMIDAQRRHLIEADEILLLIAGSVAAGLLN